ncbi:hypothetical protein ACFVFI_29795 [Streptomyces sp. NPDC057705]
MTAQRPLDVRTLNSVVKVTVDLSADPPANESADASVARLSGRS